jgi:acyl-CoA reductase-like NAD-dependent aldehyde dehydrogenase
MGLALLLAAGPGVAVAATPKAEVDTRTAQMAALARVPGTPLATTLAMEGGKAVYDVDIKTTANQIEEVKVDARSAKVLGMDSLAPSPELRNEAEAP